MADPELDESEILSQKLFYILIWSVAAYSFCAFFFAYG